MNAKKLLAAGVGVLVLVGVGAVVVLSGPGPRTTQGGGPAPASGRWEDLARAAEDAMRAQDNARAEAMLREAIDRKSDEQSLYLSLANVLMSRKDTAGAYEAYEKALAIGPREAGTEFAAGTLASMLGRNERAIEHYSAAQSIDRTNPQYPLYLGQSQLKENQSDAAVASLMLAVTLDPELAVGWGTLAEIALRENKLNIAAQHIERARALQPRDPTWRMIEARLLLRQSEPDQAIAVLRGLDESQRRDPAAMRLMAQCFGMLRLPEEAAAMYAEASDRQPQDADLAFEAALWAERAEDLSGAVRFGERAQSLGHAQAPAFVARLRDGG
ncbi:MAG: tetratricopeptide repeat protein [Phycisphaerales bacterium]|jgi:tetratricopeptide (TPR) repeat protein|nr:tetratricopeptide repeat protein [Phycisphaerales bacterium]